MGLIYLAQAVQPSQVLQVQFEMLLTLISKVGEGVHAKEIQAKRNGEKQANEPQTAPELLKGAQEDHLAAYVLVAAEERL